VIRDSLLKRVTKNLRGQPAVAGCQCTHFDAQTTLIIGGIVGVAAGISVASALAGHYLPIPTLAPIWWISRIANRKLRKNGEPNAPFVYPQVYRAVITSDRLVFVEGAESQARRSKVLAEYSLHGDLVSVSTLPDRRLYIALRSGHELRLRTKRKDAPQMVALLEPYCQPIATMPPPTLHEQPVPLGFGGWADGPPAPPSNPGYHVGPGIPAPLPQPNPAAVPWAPRS
jgi:hypothetical protein